MSFFNSDKRLSLAVGTSAVVHAGLVALLLWGGRVFSPTAMNSGPVDFIEAAVRAKPVPKASRLAPPPTASRVIPKEETGIATAKAAEPEAATSAPAVVAQSGDPNEMTRYVGLLVAAVQKNRRYPKEAIDREEEGVVGLAVKLGSNGDLIEAAVKHPSPFSSLNEAALKTVKTIAHFPKPPIADGTVIELVIPMRFKIERL